MIFLRQSTASQEVPLGYFVDATDGNTEETGLTIANTDIKVWKTGATALANKNSGGGTHISNGIYYAVMDATDTDTIGPLVLFVHVSGALTVRLECCVLDEAVYDVLFGTTALATTGNLGSSTVGTVTTLTGHTAQTGDAYARLGAPAGASVSADIAAIEAQTDDIGAAGAGLTVLATAADLATLAAAVATLATYVDTEVAAIKAKTDSLTFTSGKVQADLKSINGTTVNGDGGATPWGP